MAKGSRRISRVTGLLAVVAIMILGSVYYSRDPRVEQFFSARQARQVIGGYVDVSVLKTLALLTEETGRLNEAVTRIRSDKSDANVAAAAVALRSVRGRYALTKAFHYGPASWRDYDKRMATWPFDRVLAEHALQEMASGQLRIDARILREEKTSSLRGVYALEYLLCREGHPRRADDISAAELDYLTAAAQALWEESLDFEAAWVGTGNLPAAKATVLEKAGIANRSSFAEEFRNPGKPDSRYASASIPLQEIFQEIASVVEDMLFPVGELRDGASADNLDYRQSPDRPEDLINKIKGAAAAYDGVVGDSRGGSVSELVAKHSPVLDRRIKISFAHAAHQLEALRDLDGASPEALELGIRRAEAECEKLLARISTAAPLVTLNPAVKPWVMYGQ